MNAVLLIDFGSTFTKLTAVDVENELILGTSRSFTTIETDINEGLTKALEVLYKNIGVIEFLNTLACSSAAGGLKMIAVGLVPELTAEAGRRAALSAGAKVLKSFSYELTQDEAEEIYNLKPDILLLTGGTDGGNKKVILHNAKIISKIDLKFPVIVACNKVVAREAAEIIKNSGKEVKLCKNVMPELNVLNIEPAQTVIREVFLDRIIQAKGLTKVQNIIDGILMPTPSAVLKAAELLALGFEEEEGFGDLLIVDVGGATTDVYSIGKGEPTRSAVVLKGLPEPFAKRTVEGDLGVRYSSKSLIEEFGIEAIKKISGLTEEEINTFSKEINENPEIVPLENSKFSDFDFALGFGAVNKAIERHAGRIEIFFTLLGQICAQTGKDLASFKKIIGTGGPVISSCRAKDILAGVLIDKTKPEILRPTEIEYFLDKYYIFSAMGLLSGKFPKQALRILKSELIRL